MTTPFGLRRASVGFVALKIARSVTDPVRRKAHRGSSLRSSARHGLIFIGAGDGYRHEGFFVFWGGVW